MVVGDAAIPRITFDGKFTNAPATCADVAGKFTFGTNPKESRMARKPQMSRKAALLQGALMMNLAPKLAQDSKIDLGPVVKGVTEKNFNHVAITARVEKATKGKLAQDADLSDLEAMLIAMDATEMDDEDMAVDEDDEDKDEDKKKKAEEDDKEDEKKKDDAKAMDAAINAAVMAERKNARQIEEAREAVRPYVGKITVACDSAADVFKAALSSMKVDLTDVHPSAFGAVLKAQPLPGAKPAIAQDAASSADFSKRFPNAARVTRA